MNRRKTRRAITISALVLCVLCLLGFIGCTGSKEEPPIYSAVSDFEGKRIGVVTGTNHAETAAQTWDSCEILYFQRLSDYLPALEGDKIDGFLADEPMVRYLTQSHPEITYVKEQLVEEEYGMVFSKTQEGVALRDEFNEVLRSLEEAGTLESMQEVWFNPDVSVHPVLDYESLPNINGVVRAGMEVTDPPFEYYENEKIVGYEIELLYRFCQAQGYALEISDVEFSGVIPGVTTGKYDVACNGIAITEERKESLSFSDPVYAGGPVVAFLTENSTEAAAVSETGFFASIAESFSKTFLRENRWKLFVSGFEITLLIAVMSILFGTAFGFGTYLWYRQGNKIFIKGMNFLSWLIHGMPEVLLLLILYYVVFGQLDINGIWVSVIAFTLVFGIGVYSMLMTGANAVDKGQMEAALALGYSPNFAFFRIIFPQILRHILPGYQSSVVSLVKSTAIVGYLAVQDLTKVSDIVRSRTYDAFFPLIATAIIYFLLAWILLIIIKRIQEATLPTRRSRSKILKGIDESIREGQQ